MMIDTIVKRRTRLNGVLHEKGAKVPMTLAQFRELEPIGRFERAPVAKVVATTPKRPPKAKAVPAPSTEPKSSETAD